MEKTKENKQNPGSPDQAKTKEEPELREVTEEEIAKLRAELLEKERVLEEKRKAEKLTVKKEILPEKEAVKFPEKKPEEVKEIEEKLRAMEKEGIAPAAPVPPSPIMKDKELLRDLAHVMALPKPKQVKVLIYLAFKKGLHHAVHIAKLLRDPFILDEFHDTLVDELYDLLVKKHRLKKG